MVLSSPPPSSGTGNRLAHLRRSLGAWRDSRGLDQRRRGEDLGERERGARSVACGSLVNPIRRTKCREAKTAIQIRLGHGEPHGSCGRVAGLAESSGAPYGMKSKTVGIRAVIADSDFRSWWNKPRSIRSARHDSRGAESHARGSEFYAPPREQAKRKISRFRPAAGNWTPLESLPGGGALLTPPGRVADCAAR